MRILLVEDDAIVAAGIVEGLARSRMSVDHVGNAGLAETALATTAYDLAIVDLGLPVIDGLELIRRVRDRRMTLPILVLTARDGLEDRVKGLDIGADDYLVKPFLLPELQARLRALIRRSQAAVSSELSFGPLQLDLALRSARLSGQLLDLPVREWEVLQHLIMAAPKVLSKRKLIDSLGDWDNEVSANAVELYVSRLRAKLHASPAQIRTVRGIGYRLELS
jgi:DNA-binding response OmpR family regulator